MISFNSENTQSIAEMHKSVILLSYLSKVVIFDKPDIMQVLNDTGRSLGDFNGFLYRKYELQHSYEKFRFEGGVNKPPFETVYKSVKQYIKDVLPRERNREHELER